MKNNEGAIQNSIEQNDLMSKFVSLIKTNIKSFTMIIALLLIWALFSILTGGIFLKAQNLSNLFRQMTIIAFLAIGMVLIIVTGNIDLSVGSVTGFVSAVAAALQDYVFSIWFPKWFPALNAHANFFGVETTMNGILSTGVTIVLCMALGAVIGLYQGTLTAYFGIPAFIVTLGGLLVFRGGVLGITQGKTIAGVEKPLVFLAQGYVAKEWGIVIAIIVIILIFLLTLWNRKQKSTYGFELKPLYVDMLKASFFSLLVLAYVLYVANGYRGFQIPVLLMMIVALIFSYISTNTKFGRYCYAIGGNKEATKLSGVDIRKNILKVFVLMGLLGGAAGLILTGYVAAGTIGGGEMYELFTIASCVIGGTSLMGGEGIIVGAVVGALVMESIDNGMSIMNLQAYLKAIVKGLVLIVAVYIDVAGKRKSWFIK
jgi:D-xylose transport system permease protein